MNFNNLIRPGIRFNFNRKRFERFRFWAVMMCNYCNLSCESCAFQCDRIWPQGYKKINPVDVKNFCHTLEGIGLETPFVITGGEPTIDIEELTQVIRILKKYNRIVYLETNGYGILDLDIQTTNMIDKIALDDHGILGSLFWIIHGKIKTRYEGQIELRETLYHYNIYEARKHPANHGKKCPRFMRAPVIWDGRIYPCCILPTLSDPELDLELTGNGFYASNPELKYVLLNWRSLLPRGIIDRCLYHCHRPKIKTGSKMKITRKRDDILLSPNTRL